MHSMTEHHKKNKNVHTCPFFPLLPYINVISNPFLVSNLARNMLMHVRLLLANYLRNLSSREPNFLVVLTTKCVRPIWLLAELRLQLRRRFQQTEIHSFQEPEPEVTLETSQRWNQRQTFPLVQRKTSFIWFFFP